MLNYPVRILLKKTKEGYQIVHAWEAIQKSVDYIENHLTEDIPIDKLAETASLSPFYFQRLFSRLVKKPVCEYIKLRKLAQAADDLKTKNTRIIDTAVNYGFSSHANFTRAFKEVYGITPDEYRTSDVHLNQFVKPEPVSYTHLDVYKRQHPFLLHVPVPRRKRHYLLFPRSPIRFRHTNRI